MRISKVVIFGGTGFVGQSLCEQLQRLGIQATVPTRHPSKGTRLAHLPNVTVVPSPADDPAALQTLIAGHDAVINLIAILHGTPAALSKHTSPGPPSSRTRAPPHTPGTPCNMWCT